MLRAVMVGCGAMSNGWLKAIRETARISERIEMVGFVDLDPDVAATRAREHGFTDAATGGDLSAMLGETKPDLVFDLVVPPARREVVETALSSGCHVLSEKPMANSIAEARALLELATKKKRVHAIVQNRRHLAGIRRAKALIESRAIGELTALHADFFIGPHFGGFRERWSMCCSSTWPYTPSTPRAFGCAAEKSSAYSTIGRTRPAVLIPAPCAHASRQTRV